MLDSDETLHELAAKELKYIQEQREVIEQQLQDILDKEKEADEFAAELLMPESMLKIDVLQNRLKAEELAKKYQVSEQALWIQLVSLKLVPGDEFSEDQY
jgi:Zn-dependent peptidase ImmA (M78 family)